jgi:hypothetical protein
VLEITLDMGNALCLKPIKAFRNSSCHTGQSQDAKTYLTVAPKGVRSLNPGPKPRHPRPQALAFDVRSLPKIQAIKIEIT